MTTDAELDEWQQQWQARDAVPADLRRRVEREIRLARYRYVIPFGVTLVIGGGTLARALWSGQPGMLVLAIGVWVFIAITWATGVVLMRRVGHRPVPEGETAIAFLDFTIGVCRARLVNIAAAAALYPIFLVFVMVWRYRSGAFSTIGAFIRSDHILVVAVVTVLLAVLAVRGYRLVGRELENLMAMRKRFENGGDRG